MLGGFFFKSTSLDSGIISFIFWILGKGGGMIEVQILEY